MAPPLTPKSATTTRPSHSSARQSNPADRTSETEHVPVRVRQKREADRRGQQVARDKVKSRIAYLEQLVQQLSERDSDGQIECLGNRLSDLQKQNESLTRTLQNISELVAFRSASLAEPDALPTDTEPEVLETPKAALTGSNIHRGQNVLASSSTGVIAPWDITNVNIPSWTTQLAQTAGPSTVVSMPWPGLTTDTYSIHPTSSLDHAASVTFNPTTYSSISNFSEASTEHFGIDNRPLDSRAYGKPGFQQHDHATELGPELWRQTNQILMEHYQMMSGTASPSDSIMNEHVPIRVMIEGWDAVSQRVHLPPVWQVLRRVDEFIFQGCHKRERLGILYLIHLVMQSHRDPTPLWLRTLPTWYLKRPSQTLDHSYAINYFPWPGLRERFVFQEHLYSTNIFWHLFTQCVRLNWAYDFRDCYRLDINTGLYTLSPDFRQCIREIKNWTMGPDIFIRYPELYSEIPAFSTIPGSVSNTMQYQLANLPMNASNKRRRISMQEQAAYDEQYH